MTRGPFVMVKREKRALSGFLIRHLGSVGALRGQLRSDGQRCELVVIDRRCSARGHRFGWMSTLLSRADADPNGRRAQRIGAWSTAIGAWTQVQTDNKLAWRKRIARSSLIRRWAHSAPPKVNLCRCASSSASSREQGGELGAVTRPSSCQ
jgi:hypothetical protein